ncbi:MAG: hypothetical protein ACOC80_16820, partial [Petrotogales bacterium]
MIFFIEQELPHYRIPIFAALQDGLGDDLIVCAGRPPASANFITSNATQLPFTYLELKTLCFTGEKLYMQNWRIAFKRYGLPEIVIVRHAIRNLSLFPLLLFCKYNRIPVVVWGQGYSRNRAFNPHRNLLDRFHLAIVRLADAYVCYTPEILETLSQYVEQDKLFVATNT